LFGSPSGHRSFARAPGKRGGAGFQLQRAAPERRPQHAPRETAQIPGRAAPVLVTEDMVKAMKPGSVIVDLAAPQGGNCPLTEPGQTVVKHGVTLIGETNVPALVAAVKGAQLELRSPQALAGSAFCTQARG
jgi:hypothetical protein